MKELTCRSWGVSNSYKVEKLNQLIRGWINYFKIGSMKTLCKELDSRIRYRLRMCIWKQWKTPQNQEKNHGTMCVLAEDASKAAIWAGMKARHVYGVSRSRMEIDFTADDKMMGDVIAPGKHNMKISICAADAIDRVELLKNNVLEEMIVHSGSWENKKFADDEVIRVKFTVEFGWGPNPRFYKDMLVKEWDGSLNVEGKLLSIDKTWNS